MKITRLLSENIKRIVTVEIKPDGNMIEITGRNDAGKSAVLDSIFWALAGTGSHQPMPIRDGQTEARIVLEMGDLVVKRRFKKDAEGTRVTTKVTLGRADGANYSRPQERLDEMISALAFDPLAFAEAKPEEQYKILRGFVQGVDWDKTEAETKADFDQRTLVNRDVNALEARLGAKLETLPVLEPMDTSGIRKQMAGANQVQADNAALAQQRLMLTQNIAAMRTLSEQDEQRIGQIEEDIKTKQVEIARLQENNNMRLEGGARDEAAIGRLAAPEPEPDIMALQAKLEQAQTHNQRCELTKQAKDKQAEADALTRKLDERKEFVRLAVENSNMPASGLELKDGQVFLNGAPLVQAGTAMKYKLSGAIMVGMNPTLRVVLVRNSNLLDEDGRAFYQALADEHDFQFWMERVDSSGEIGFYIEDGRVAARDGEPVAPAMIQESASPPGVVPPGPATQRLADGAVETHTEEKPEAMGSTAQATPVVETATSPGNAPAPAPAPMTDQQLSDVGQVDETDDDTPPSDRQQGLTL